MMQGIGCNGLPVSVSVIRDSPVMMPLLKPINPTAQASIAVHSVVQIIRWVRLPNASDASLAVCAVLLVVCSMVRHWFFYTAPNFFAS